MIDNLRLYFFIFATLIIPPIFTIIFRTISKFLLVDSSSNFLVNFISLIFINIEVILVLFIIALYCYFLVVLFISLYIFFKILLILIYLLFLFLTGGSLNLKETRNNLIFQFDAIFFSSISNLRANENFIFTTFILGCFLIFLPVMSMLYSGIETSFYIDDLFSLDLSYLSNPLFITPDFSVFSVIFNIKFLTAILIFPILISLIFLLVLSSINFFECGVELIVRERLFRFLFRMTFLFGVNLGFIIVFGFNNLTNIIIFITGIPMLILILLPLRRLRSKRTINNVKLSDLLDEKE